VEGEPVYEACGIDKAGDTEDRYRSIQLLRRRIANNRRIQLLREAFPDARFLCVVRDGRAVAHSLSRVDWWPDQHVWWFGDTPRHWEAAGGDPWELRAKDWVHELNAIEAGLADVDRDKKLLIRYEDLVENPIETFVQMSEFVGLAPSNDWAKSLAELSFSNRNTVWEDLLPDSAARTALEIQRDHLERYGYPT
jgi:hypothetical protein